MSDEQHASQLELVNRYERVRAGGLDPRIDNALAITTDGAIRVLADHVTPDDPVRYANSIVVARDGTIYFTDASGRFAPADWGGTLEASVLDILEQAATGRVLSHDPATGLTRIVAHGFSFANGIALSADERTLFVSETGRYRIWSVDRRAGDLDVRGGSPQASVLLDNLPGYPDNLMRGRDGRIWVGLFRPRNPAADGLSQKPAMRKVLLRLPRSLTSRRPSGSQPSPLGKSSSSSSTRRAPSSPTLDTVCWWKSENQSRPSCHRGPSGIELPEASL